MKSARRMAKLTGPGCPLGEIEYCTCMLSIECGRPMLAACFRRSLAGYSGCSKLAGGAFSSAPVGAKDIYCPVT